MDRLRQGDSNQIFEPLGRCRAFTWHGNISDYHNSTDQPTIPELSTVVESLNTDERKNEVLNLKKPSTRRNAWGCMSYADLITKAIESVPEKRLTLSQIYAWMIQNVPYFKDKGESNSSAGWKNSVRHNLSLHRKFVRVQNEGTGKSSWWIVNNDVKSCKSPRRRAASMDNRSYEKKKCQTTAKQNHLQERSPTTASHTKSDASVVPEVQRLDSFATAFSPIDLRSNGKDAALKSGLLSPMGMATELPLGDEVMKQPSPLYWNRCHNVNPPYLHPEGMAETVGESLAEIFTPDMSSTYEPSFLPDRQLTVLQNIGSDRYVSDSSYLSFHDLPSPPPYAGHPPASAEGDLFPQADAKELLQLSTSSNQSDVLSGAQYMTRTGVSMHQGLQGDVLPMPKYYPERGEGGFPGVPCGRSSVLRQMLMQAQQQGGLLSGYVDHQPLESVVKSEPAEIDAFSYRDTDPFPSETVLPARSVLSAANEGQGSILDYRKLSEYVVIKQETDVDETLEEEDCRREAWNFNSTSSDADARRDN